MDASKIIIIGQLYDIRNMLSSRYVDAIYTIVNSYKTNPERIVNPYAMGLIRRFHGLPARRRRYSLPGIHAEFSMRVFCAKGL